MCLHLRYHRQLADWLNFPAPSSSSITAETQTTNWVRLPLNLLAHVSTRITNEVRGVNRVVYDISTKPPSTIEWE